MVSRSRKIAFSNTESIVPSTAAVRQIHSNRRWGRRASAVQNERRLGFGFSSLPFPEDKAFRRRISARTSFRMTPSSLPSIRRDASIGIKNNATANEVNSANTTVSDISPNTWPAMPWTNTMGKKTAMVVSVEAKTAPPTSLVPRMEARWIESPSSRHRKMLSNTTMELSTSIPTPSASPPRDIMLRDTSNRYIPAKVATMETGMATLMIRVWAILRRNRYNTKMASRPPRNAVFLTSLIAF